MRRSRAKARRQSLQAVLWVAILLGHAQATPLPAPFQAPGPLPDPAVGTTDVEVSGQVLYGSGDGASTAAVVDIVEVYNNNAAYLRLKAFGLTETEGRGKTLFEEARSNTNKALAFVARRHGVDVITVPGGVTSDNQVADLTREVIDQLPIYAVEGTLLHGSNPRTMQAVGELDSQTVLESIPAYLEWKALDPTDAQYHLLKASYLDQFSKAVKKVARDQGLDGIAEKGDVTSRLGPVPDVTRAVVEALAG